MKPAQASHRPIDRVRGDDHVAQSAGLRARFADHVWLAVTAFALVVLFCGPLRPAQIQISPLEMSIGAGMALTIVVAFPFRRRLPEGVRSALPVVFPMAGAAIASHRQGLEDIGLVMFMMANVAVAMLFGRTVTLACFALSCVVLGLTGYALAAHRQIFGFSPVYGGSGLSWIIATITYVSVGSVGLIGIISYRESSFGLAQRLANQRDEIAAQRDRIAVLATHDPLTGLPNWQLAHDRLSMACHQGARTGEPLAILFIDLDGFKDVNDGLGHSAGDEVLRTMGARLSRAIRASDTAARLGGDEFLVILSSGVSVAGAQEVADKLTAEIERPVMWRGAPIKLSASCGVAMFPDDGDNPDDLLRHADQAMYESKQTRSAARRTRRARARD